MIAVENFNLGISVLVVLGQVLVFVLLLLVIWSKLFKKDSVILNFISSKSILFSLIVALVATAGSLFYSDVIGYDPCKLCWFQRIFIYPQVLLGFIALILKDKKANHYLFWFSAVAFSIATYHYLGQVGLTNLSCDIVGFASKCSNRFVMHFGYITIPMMALTATLMNMVFNGIALLKKSK